MSNTPDMFEGTGKETGLLSQSDAVEVLLNQNLPIEDNKEVNEEESVEEAQAETTEEDTVKVEETEETTVETEEEEAESEDETEVEQEVQEESESEFVLELDGTKMNADQIAKEWENRGLRQSDYTRKTQELAEQKRVIESDKAQTLELQQKLSESLKEAEQILTQNRQEPNWSELSQQLEPQKFNLVKTKWEEGQRQLAHIQEQRKAVAEKEHYDMMLARQQHLQNENAKLLDYFPTWNDAVVRNKAVDDLKLYMRNQGLTEQAIQNLNDNGSADAIKFLMKAKAYDELQANMKKVKVTKQKKQLPTKAKSGTPTTKKEVSSKAKEKAFQKLSKSGKIEDAVNLLLTQ